LKYDLDLLPLTFGQIHRGGTLTALHWISRSCYKAGINPDIARAYHEALTKLLPGTRVYDRPAKDLTLTDVRTGPRVKIDRPDIALMAGKVDAWLQTIVNTAEKFEAALEHSVDGDA